MVGSTQNLGDTEKFLAHWKKLHTVIAAPVRLPLFRVASRLKIVVLFRQESAPLQVGTLLGSQSVQANVAATFIRPGAAAQSLLDPRRAETESGRAAFRGGAALRLNESDGLA